MMKKIADLSSYFLLNAFTSFGNGQKASRRRFVLSVAGLGRLSFVGHRDAHRKEHDGVGQSARDEPPARGHDRYSLDRNAPPHQYLA